MLIKHTKCSPKPILSLKSFLGDEIQDESELSLELLTKLEQERTARDERNQKSKGSGFVSDSSSGPDILREGSYNPPL